MKPAHKMISGWFIGCVLTSTPLFPQTIPVTDTLWRLAAQEDTDGDQKITIHDHVTPFVIRDQSGAEVRILTNFYEMSVLLQELKRAGDLHTNEINMDHLGLDESVVERTHRLIKDKFWNALTRRIDAASLDEVERDSKSDAKHDYLYVPGNDPVAVKYFEDLAKVSREKHHSPPLKVVLLPTPDKFTSDFVRNLDGEHGLLTLKLEVDAHGHPTGGVPYVVPGGRFNELYCWDSYFIVLGLVQDQRADLARGMADNLLYQVQHYGMVPNANRTYYLTRSQPPFLTSIIRALSDAGMVDKKWVANALKITLIEYQNVWLGKDRLVKIGPYALSRYYDMGNGPCPEVEPGHYDEKMLPWLKQLPVTDAAQPLTPFRFINEYLYAGKFTDLRADGMTLDEFFKSDRALRESGHDTTHRFDDRTVDFVSVDLNSLLYKYEMDFAELLEKDFGGRLPELGGEFAEASYWRQRTAARKEAMLALMWDDERGYFFDYDYVNGKRSTYISATGLYPLWAKMLDANNPIDLARAKQAADYACRKLEQPTGLSATAKESVTAARRKDERQWDYPYGWAPHQMLAWRGLKNYGLDDTASRLAYRWLYVIAKNAHDYNGMITEKYNVVTGSHEVFAEYGNVGTKFAYIATEGFGWMNASFEVGLNYLTPKQLADLNQLKPPPK